MTVSTDYSNRDMFISSQLRDEATTVKDDAIGKEAFLTMMVAQLKNQDPLSPLEGTDFTAQLAQFSGLEQQITMNDYLEEILTSLNQSSENSSVFDYIGKEIVSDGNPVTLEGGEVISGGAFELEEAATIHVTIYNESGQAVRYMSSGTEMIEEGAYNVEWDGRDDDGYKVLDGEYTYEVLALNSDGEYTTVSTTVSGFVDGITNVYGKNYLIVDGRRIDPSSVASVILADDES